MKAISLQNTSLGVKTVLVILSAIAVSLGLVGITKAAIPNSSTGAIEACRRNSAGLFDAQGTLRVIDVQAGQTCNSGETALSWPSTSSAGSFYNYSGRIWALRESNPIRYASLTEDGQDSGSRIAQDLLSPPQNVDVINFSAKLLEADFSTDTEFAYTPVFGESYTFSLMVGSTAYTLCTIASPNNSCTVTNPGIQVPANSQVALRKVTNGCSGGCITGASWPVAIVSTELQ